MRRAALALSCQRAGSGVDLGHARYLSAEPQLSPAFLFRQRSSIVKPPVARAGAAGPIDAARALRLSTRRPAWAGPSPEARERLAQRLPARPRPDRAFDPVPPPRVQDAGVRQLRGRPFPHPADPLARGGADRPRHGPGAAASTRIWPRRSRWRTISATARSAMPARRRWTRRWPASAASTTICRPSASSPGSSGAMPDFDGLNLTVETLEGLVKHHGPRGGARCRPRWPSIRWRRRLALDQPAAAGGADRGDRRRRRLQPTTISTTACAPASSRSTSWRRCRWPAPALAEVDRLLSRPGAAAARPRDDSPPDRRHGARSDRGRAGAAWRAGAGSPDAVRALPATHRRLLARDRGRACSSCASSCATASIATTRSTACRSRRGAWCASSRRSCWPRRTACRTAGASGPAPPQLARHRRHRTGLYRRHDRSLRARRARPPVQAEPGPGMNPFARAARTSSRGDRPSCRPTASCRPGWISTGSRSSRRAIAAHGEAATNAALVLAKAAGKPPMAICRPARRSARGRARATHAEQRRARDSST